MLSAGRREKAPDAIATSLHRAVAEAGVPRAPAGLRPEEAVALCAAAERNWEPDSVAAAAPGTADGPPHAFAPAGGTKERSGIEAVVATVAAGLRVVVAACSWTWSAVTEAARPGVVCTRETDPSIEAGLATADTAHSAAIGNANRFAGCKGLSAGYCPGASGWSVGIPGMDAPFPVASDVPVAVLAGSPISEGLPVGETRVAKEATGLGGAAPGRAGLTPASS
jgi:hypothetical protein